MERARKKDVAAEIGEMIDAACCHTHGRELAAALDRELKSYGHDGVKDIKRSGRYVEKHNTTDEIIKWKGGIRAFFSIESEQTLTRLPMRVLTELRSAITSILGKVDELKSMPHVRSRWKTDKIIRRNDIHMMIRKWNDGVRQFVEDVEAGTDLGNVLTISRSSYTRQVAVSLAQEITKLQLRGSKRAATRINEAVKTYDCLVIERLHATESILSQLRTLVRLQASRQEIIELIQPGNSS